MCAYLLKSCPCCVCRPVEKEQAKEDSANGSKKLVGINRVILVVLSCAFPCGLVVRIRRSHRRGRGSIPRMGVQFLFFFFSPPLFLFSLPFPPFFLLPFAFPFPFFLFPFKIFPFPLAFQNEQEATISKTEPPAKELEQLDVLLSRAQKLRIGTKPEEKLSKKSIKLASSIYKASDHGNSTTRPHKEAAARQRTKDQTRTKQTGHAQSKSVTSLLGRDVERSRATRSTSLKGRDFFLGQMH